ncbi:MAG: hypothetical protein QM727_02155 [Niabella sp.]
MVLAKIALLCTLRRGMVVSLFLFFSVHTVTAQMNFGELEQRMSKEKRYIVVYITSKYCTYCLMQDAQIKKHKELKQKLDRNYYFVKEVAESDSIITFNNKEYANPEPKNPYQVNDFVNVYGHDEKGSIGYPLWLYFDKDYRLLLRFHGLMPPGNILKVLDKIEKSGASNNNQYHE